MQTHVDIPLWLAVLVYTVYGFLLVLAVAFVFALVLVAAVIGCVLCAVRFLRH